jgi:hypothetical protein
MKPVSPWFPHVNGNWTNNEEYLLKYPNDNKNIEAFALKYPSFTIIVPKETTVKMKNVICLYDLNIRETEDGKNLLIYAFIASFCPVIVAKEIGGALTIFNRDMMKSTLKQHIILLYSEYLDTAIKNNFGASMLEGLHKLILQDNKHLITLSKYDSDTIIGEIDKIGEIHPYAPLPSGGSRKYNFTKKRNIYMRGKRSRNKKTKNTRKLPKYVKII